jgi:hypothetical protein
MRPYLTIVALLVVATLMSATGTGVAFQGFGQSGSDASKAQYPVDLSGPTNQPDLPTSEEPAEGPPVVGGPNQPERPTIVDRQDVLSEEAFGGSFGDDPQLPRQVEAGTSLPFTGFAAIPVLVLAVALVVAGLALRRQAPRED